MLNIKYLSNLKHNLKHAGIAQKITKVNELFHNIQIFLSLKLLPLVKTKILIQSFKDTFRDEYGIKENQRMYKSFHFRCLFLLKKKVCLYRKAALSSSLTGQYAYEI